MAESFDPSSFINALNRLTDATEESALAQMGYVDRERNALQTRVEIENRINKELLATYGEKEFYGSRSKTLFKKSLGDLGYIVDETGKIAKAINSPEMTGAQKRQIARLTELDRKQKETVEAQVFFVRNIKQGAADIGKNMASFGAELARGNTSFTTLNPIIDAVGNTLSNLAKAMPVVGEYAGAAIKGIAEGSKLILELAQQNLQTFQDLSSVGATVVNGMTGLQTQILTSGMTQTGFTKTIKENAAILGRYGGTVGEGANKFSNAVGMLTTDKGPLKQAGMELRKLGLTADSIGERAAAYLEQEMLLGKGRSMTEDQLARGTVAYTKELTALQKITGRSREDIENERKKILNRSRFSATMSDMQAKGFTGGAKAALSMMTSLPEDMKAGFEELLSGVMGPESAKLVQTFGTGIIDLVNSFKTAKTDMEGGAAFDAFNTGMQGLAKGSTEMTRQISMITNETGFTSFATQLQFATNKMPSFNEALKKVEEEGKNKDKLTDPAIKAQIAMERLSGKMLELANLVMPDVATATEKFTTALRDAADLIAELFGKTSPSNLDRAKSTLKGSAIGAGVLGTVGGIAGFAVGGPAGAALGAKAGTVLGTGVGGYIGDKLATRSAPAAAPSAAAPSAAAPSAAASESKPGLGSSPMSGSPPAAQPKDHSSGGSDASRIKLSKISSVTGKSASVDQKYAPAFQGLVSYLDSVGYEIKSLGGFNDRDIRDMPGVKSVHAKGAAIDINPNENKFDARLITDMPPDIGKVANSFGLGWGGNWTRKKDAMHFSAAANEGGSLLQAKYGGIASGPQTGFPAMLHGPKEAIIPLATDSILEKMATTPSNTFANSSKVNTSDSMIISMLVDKFDAMINLLSNGNDIQDQLLRHSRI